MLHTTANSEADSRNRKNQKPNKMRMIISIIAVLLVIYLVVAIIVTVNEGVSTTIALNGAVSDDIRTSGYIFRNQEIITAPSGGFLKSMVSEGEKVKSGQVVAYIFSVEPDPELVQKIKDVHRLLRVKSGDVDEAAYIDDGYSSSGVVSERVRNMSDLRKNRDLSVIKDKKEALNDILSSGSNESDINKSIDELNAELQSLKAQAGGGIEIKAPVAGVFSARIDGFEDKLNLEAADTVTPSYIKDLNKIEIKEETEIVTGQPLCKIVNNYTWSYGAVVDEKYLENVSVGQLVEIEFYDLPGNSIIGKISRISDSEGGEKAVVISTNRYVDGIYSISRIGADVILEKAEGIKLPASSLHVLDGVTGVYVVRLDKAQFVPVNVKYRNDEWAIVSAAEPEYGEEKLRIYDEVIVSGKNIENDEIVR